MLVEIIMSLLRPSKDRDYTSISNVIYMAMFTAPDIATYDVGRWFCFTVLSDYRLSTKSPINSLMDVPFLEVLRVTKARPKLSKSSKNA